MISFKCPECKQALECDVSMLGEIADCEHCGKTITIPKPGDHKKALAKEDEQLGMLKQINQNLMSLRESCAKIETCIVSFYLWILWSFFISLGFALLAAIYNYMRPLFP